MCDRWRQRERGESSLEWKIDGEGDEPDDGSTDIIRKGHAEVCAWVGIIINRTQEPAVASECQRIDDHIDEGKQEGGQQVHGPTRSCVHIKL